LEWVRYFEPSGCFAGVDPISARESACRIESRADMESAPTRFLSILGVEKRCALATLEDVLIGHVEQRFEKTHFVRVYVALSDLHLGKGTAGYVTAPELELRRKRLLCHTRPFAEDSDVVADLFLIFVIHCVNPVALI